MERMRKITALLLLAALVCAPAAGADETRLDPQKILDPSTLTGKDWLALSRAEKGLFVFSAIQAFKACRVPTSVSADEYTAWMDAEIASDHAVHDVKAKYILTAMILVREPYCRQAIEKLKI